MPRLLPLGRAKLVQAEPGAGEPFDLARISSVYISQASQVLPPEPEPGVQPEAVDITVEEPWNHGPLRIWFEAHKPPRRGERPFWVVVRAEVIEASRT